jgi:MFS family permease
MDESQVSRQGWRVVAASAVGLFFWSLPPYSFAVFLKPIAEDLHLSREAVSSMFSGGPLMAALSAAPVGYLLDRLGARPIVIPFLAIAGCAFALRALIEPPLWPFFFLFALSGAAGVGASPIGYARLVSTWFDRQRGLALGVAIAGGALGAIVHPSAAEALIRAIGWRSAHVVLGGLVLLVGLPVVVMFVKPRPVRQSIRPGVDSALSGASFGEGVRSPVFWVLAVVLLCDSIANSSLSVHLSALLTDRGLSASHGAAALSAMGAAALVGRISAGWLLDRYFAPRVSFGLLVITAAGIFVLASARTFEAAMAGALLVGFGMGGEYDVTPYLLTRYFGLRAFSTLYGLSYAAVGVAWAIGPILMGRAFDATGSYEPHLLRLAVALLGVSALMLLLPRYAAPPAERPMPSEPVSEPSQLSRSV